MNTCVFMEWGTKGPTTWCQLDNLLYYSPFPNCSACGSLQLRSRAQITRAEMMDSVGKWTTTNRSVNAKETSRAPTAKTAVRPAQPADQAQRLQGRPKARSTSAKMSPTLYSFWTVRRMDANPGLTWNTLWGRFWTVWLCEVTVIG